MLKFIINFYFDLAIANVKNLYPNYLKTKVFLKIIFSIFVQTNKARTNEK